MKSRANGLKVSTGAGPAARFVAIAGALAAFAGAAWAADGAVTVDASVAPPPPEQLSVAAGGTSPSGGVLAVNRRYLLRDGRPWFPVMGEFHYARYPADEWERELLKMKAGGIDIVATYVFWIFHEETEGRFDWEGRRNLGEFVRLCGRHGLKVWLRIGPWDHGEVRNGGFPDWVASGRTRENDPVYLQQVRTFFAQIGQQVKGLFWQDGGPIIGVQLENEYHPPGDGEAHLRRLRELAREAGIDAPFFSATGWDRAVVPAADFLPVFGGYTDQFWSDSRTELPPNQNFFFTDIRAEDNVGPDLQPRDRRYNDRYAGYPFLTAEMGAGMAIAYHRRPVMLADDSTAAALVKLGSGAAMLGYYMYHGGTNPDGNTSMQETLKTWNGYNDLEAKSYDFQAPLGEFGQVRPVYRTLKTLHLFLHDFGDRLAPMAPYFPEQTPANRDDTTTPRVAVRSDGTRAFLFLNNYQRNHPLVDHPNFQVDLRLPAERIRIPFRPVNVPAGVYAIWPVNLDVGGVNLQYATTQLVCRLDDPETFVFFAWPGVRAEFAFQDTAGGAIAAPGAQVAHENGIVTVTGIAPGTRAAIRLHAPGGKDVQIVVLTREGALNLWKARLEGRERLLLSPAGLFADAGKLHVFSEDPAAFRIGVFPALAGRAAGWRPAGEDGIFQQFTHPVDAVGMAVDVRQTRAAAPSVPARINPDPRRGIALEPDDADFDRAAVWSIRFPDGVAGGPNRPLLEITYTGDVARLRAGARFLDDNFYRGTPFAFGLWRLKPEERREGIDLQILPLREDTPLYLPGGARPPFDRRGDALGLESVSLSWEYDAVMDLGR